MIVVVVVVMVVLVVYTGKDGSIRDCFIEKGNEWWRRRRTVEEKKAMKRQLKRNKQMVRIGVTY